MGYNKLIIYGNNLELYEYEKPLPERIFTSYRKHAGAVQIGGLDSSGENSLPTRVLGKRPDHARRAKNAFRRLVSANLNELAYPVLLTFTYEENQQDLSIAYKDFNAFIRHARYGYGKSFSYISVPEFQRRGAVHFHALFWGLPEKLLLQERRTRRLASLWGKGFIYVKKTDGNEKLSTYLAKYMVKTFLDPRLRNKKAYVASRNILKPQIVGGIDSVNIVLEDYEVVDKTPFLDRKYMTSWLGAGRYRHYKLV